MVDELITTVLKFEPNSIFLLPPRLFMDYFPFMSWTGSALSISLIFSSHFLFSITFPLLSTFVYVMSQNPQSCHVSCKSLAKTLMPLRDIQSMKTT